MIYDPLYLVILGVCAVLSIWAAARTKGAFAKYSKLPVRSGLTGAQVAERILAQNGIRDVQVEPVRGHLSDHYDPRSRTLRLSEQVYASSSMAAVGVAAHEVGHAIQDATEYPMLRFRSAWVPVANTGSGISMFLIIAAFLLGGAGSVLGASLAWAGVLLFATTTVFTLVTLPVEFDASRRALAALEGGRYVSDEELAGAKKVLDAAAMTYVAAFATSLLTLLYWMMRLGLLGGRNE